MIDPKIEFKGFKELDDVLGTLPDKVGGRVLQRSVNSAVRKGRKEIKDAAPRGKAPSAASKKYGPLHKNIKVGKARASKRSAKAAYVSTGNAFWGYFLEFGTRSIPAKPWFVPAFERMRRAMLEKLRENLKKAIDKELKKLKR